MGAGIPVTGVDSAKSLIFFLKTLVCSRGESVLSFHLVILGSSWLAASASSCFRLGVPWICLIQKMDWSSRCRLQD